ncbi:hypothetical protein [Thalassobacillus pellis]|uniref:hypothetical protein n=1 Tax=Thalassobacillus pellis TaxID=748008 RepID=UPI001960B8B9|nr:hypothetical protein [Thalassobacillus pellis]MBM7553033.1 hypothetical protein [Thalassobacillus pellis]
MKRNFLDQFYTIDRNTGEYIIEIGLNSYDDIFNSWDSSVYNLRDLDSSLKSFLEECSYDIDLHNDIVLRFHMQNEKGDPKVENTVITSLRNFFNYRLHFIKKEMDHDLKKVVVYVAVSLVLTFFSLYLPEVLDVEIVFKIILQAVQLGGWVFLWEAFTLVFLQGRAPRKLRKEYRRLLHAPIRFQYNE